VTIFYSLKFETSLFVASYDSQGHGADIRPRLHTGLTGLVEAGLLQLPRELDREYHVEGFIPLAAMETFLQQFKCNGGNSTVR
jgi:hypothetical protein